jgi:predicted TIM-barrel fold metal-dependent hydrolase
MRSALAPLVAAIAIAAPPAHAADRPLQFIDAHSHLLPNMTLDEEMAMFKQAGVKAVVIESVPPERRQELAAAYPHYIVPFVGFARSRNTSQPPLNAETLALFDKQLKTGEACGFGETGTMMDPREEPAASLLNPMYFKVYELAAKYRAPVTYHVDLDKPEVIENFGRAAAMYPRMPLILAHAGFNAGPQVVGPLLDAHPNIYVDLSIRLDPLNGFSDAPGGKQDPRTMLDANGALTPEWRSLLERHADRFLFAMDIAPTGPKGREQRAVELTDIARKALSVLPRKSQEAIAHGNAERLLRGCKAGPR